MRRCRRRKSVISAVTSELVASQCVATTPSWGDMAARFTNSGFAGRWNLSYENLGQNVITHVPPATGSVIALTATAAWTSPTRHGGEDLQLLNNRTSDVPLLHG